MSRSRLVILDANIVIHLHQIGLWSQLVGRYQIILSRVVAEQEVLFFEEEDGQRQDIDLSADINSGAVEIVDVTASQLAAFMARFDPLYIEVLDPGEAESLAYLDLHNQENQLICSADNIVYRVLPHLQLSDRGVSLEELLERCGMRRSLPHMYSQAYREKWTQKGAEEWIRGQGSRR